MLNLQDQFIYKYYLEWKEKIEKRHHRIFILPTRFGTYFIIIIFTLFLISLSYGQSLALTGTFIFVSVVVVSAHYTNFNLYGIRHISHGKNMNIFADEDFYIWLKNEWSKPRPDIKVEVILKNNFKNEYLKLEGECSIRRKDRGKFILESNKEFLKRGVYSFSKIRIATDFPFGLFRYWSFLEPGSSLVYIYPRPINPKQKTQGRFQYQNKRNREDLKNKDPFHVENPQTLQHGSDSFHEHAKYENTGGINRIDWKIYSRTNELYHKKYQDFNQSQYLLDRKDWPQFSLEEQLSILCYWVREYTAKGHKFALVLQNEYPIWGEGKEFEMICLRRLCEFDEKLR